MRGLENVPPWRLNSSFWRHKNCAIIYLEIVIGKKYTDIFQLTHPHTRDSQ
jgi:hypothetical protein